MSNGDLKDFISVHVELGQPIPEDEIIELFLNQEKYIINSLYLYFY